LADVTIAVLGDGPYLVQGPARIIDFDGNEFRLDQELTVLCRCGQSGRKPFCDGTHDKIAFSARTRANLDGRSDARESEGVAHFRVVSEAECQN